MRGINKCPYCGSHNVVVLSGKSDHPFDKRPGREETICLDCRGKLPTGENDVKSEVRKTIEEELEEILEDYHYNQNPFLKHMVRLEGVSVCKGVRSESMAEFPYEDGVYSMTTNDYPLCHFPKVTIEKNTINLDGEAIKMDVFPVTVKREFIAYGYEKVPWTEFVEITITEDWKSV